MNRLLKQGTVSKYQVCLSFLLFMVILAGYTCDYEICRSAATHYRMNAGPWLIISGVATALSALMALANIIVKDSFFGVMKNAGLVFTGVRAVNVFLLLLSGLYHTLSCASASADAVQDVISYKSAIDFAITTYNMAVFFALGLIISLNASVFVARKLYVEIRLMVHVLKQEKAEKEDTEC